MLLVEEVLYFFWAIHLISAFLLELQELNKDASTANTLHIHFLFLNTDMPWISMVAMILWLPIIYLWQFYILLPTVNWSFDI